MKVGWEDRTRRTILIILGGALLGILFGLALGCGSGPPSPQTPHPPDRFTIVGTSQSWVMSFYSLKDNVTGECFFVARYANNGLAATVAQCAP